MLHFHLKSGRDAAEHSAYIERRGYHRRRGDLVASIVENMPAWADLNSQKFWKAARAYERRNGAVYREAIIALPTELSRDQNIALAEELGSFLAPNRPRQIAVHQPVSSIEALDNPHCHVMYSDRVDDGIERNADKFFCRPNAKYPERGGRRKASGGLTSMELRDDVIAKRYGTAQIINRHLEMHGHEARVDHRSLGERGEQRPAERHFGAKRVREMSEAEKKEVVSRRARVRLGARLEA